MDSQSLQYKAPKQPTKTKPVLIYSDKASLYKLFDFFRKKKNL